MEKEKLWRQHSHHSISSTFWTERIGSVAGLKTLEVMEKLQLWDTITQTGLNIKDSWQKLADKYELEISQFGLPALTGFSFASEKNLYYKTLVTQEMLKKGYLASNVVYVCTEHTKPIVEGYMEALDPIFSLIKECEQGRSVEGLLNGRVCHSGFKKTKLKMNIVFRCDASIQIGTGHVMRCLTLADELAHQGAKCHFICREHEGHLIKLIAQKGYDTYKLEVESQDIFNKKNDNEPVLFHSKWLGSTQEEDARQTEEIIKTLQPEWLVIDHYALDSYWEKKLRPHYNNILVIDYLADRKHDCEVLIDQTFGRDEQDYHNLAPNHCAILCGTTYALLRPEFSKWRQYSLERRKDNSLQHVLINLGGVDKDNITSHILELLKKAPLPKSCKVTVVMGSYLSMVGCCDNQG